MSTSPTSSSVRNGGIRKNMRKGTHSCFECRRRKIRCNFTSSNQSVCTECFARGSKCIDQEHADPNIVVDQRKNLKERVARLESLLDMLLDERSSLEAVQTLRNLGAEPIQPPTPRSGKLQQSVISSPEDSIGGYSQAKWDNKNIQQESSMGKKEKLPPRMQIAPFGNSDDMFVTLPTAKSKTKDERVSRLLKEAFPSPEQLQEALNSHAEWWTKITSVMVGPGGMPKELTNIHSFVKWAMDSGGPLEVAKVLQLCMSCESGDSELERNLELMEHLIIQDDEYMGTLAGIEVAFGQARHYSELGQIRRAWLTTRRALNFAQLMGLHRTRINIRQDFAFWGLFQFDRFCSLMLGSPYLVSDAHCNLTFKAKELPLIMNNNGFLTKLSMVAGKVIDRVQACKDTTFAALLTLDQEITRLGDQMPQEFWTLEDSPNSFTGGNSWMEKALGHIIYHQVRMVLHLPYLLRSVTSPGFEYSRDACIESARSILRLFQGLRNEANQHAYKVKGIDFVAITAATTVVMGLIGGIRPPTAQMDTVRQQSLDQMDWDLLESTLETFKRVEKKPFGKIASQSRRVLERLTQLRDPNHEPDETSKILIPFFGTITVQRGAFRVASEANSPARYSAVPSSATGSSSRRVNTVVQKPPTQSDMYTPAAAPQMVAYNGPYLHVSPYENAEYYVDQGISGISDHMSHDHLPPAHGWQNVGTFDLDQDWNWDMFEVSNFPF